MKGLKALAAALTGRNFPRTFEWDTVQKEAASSQMEIWIRKESAVRVGGVGHLKRTTRDPLRSTGRPTDDYSKIRSEICVLLVRQWKIF